MVARGLTERRQRVEARHAAMLRYPWGDSLARRGRKVGLPRAFGVSDQRAYLMRSQWMVAYTFGL